MPALGWYAVVLGVAAAATAVAAGPAAWVSRKVGYVSVPGERTIHLSVTAYGGGPAMLIGFLVAMMAAAELRPLRSVFVGSSEPLGIVLAAAAIFTVGLIDDAREMSAPAKVAGQVLAATILYFLGVTLYWFKVPLGGVVSLTPGITPLIMALWVIALTNAVNLIDGLDGLAAGVVAIGGGALGVYGLKLMGMGVLSRTNIGPLIAVIACGICLGFLPFNFHPAKMFMGDAGSLLLGLLMSASTMVIGGRIPPSSPTTGLTYFFFAPLLIPFFIMGVPLVDMAFAFVRRTARGTGFDTPDKDHIHHRLLRLGHGHRRSVVILWAWTAILSGFILFPLFVKAVNPFIPLGVGILAAALVTWFHPGLRRRPAPAQLGTGEPIDVAAPGGRRGHAAGVILVVDDMDDMDDMDGGDDVDVDGDRRAGDAVPPLGKRADGGVSGQGVPGGATGNGVRRGMGVRASRRGEGAPGERRRAPGRRGSGGGRFAGERDEAR